MDATWNRRLSIDRDRVAEAVLDQNETMAGGSHQLSREVKFGIRAGDGGLSSYLKLIAAMPLSVETKSKAARYSD
jgi:hypothetical protein